MQLVLDDLLDALNNKVGDLRYVSDLLDVLLEQGECLYKAGESADVFLDYW